MNTIVSTRRSAAGLMALALAAVALPSAVHATDPLVVRVGYASIGVGNRLFVGGSSAATAHAEGYLETALQRVPSGRTGDPRELAATAVWLASDAAGYVTGQMIPVDGGLTIA